MRSQNLISGIGTWAGPGLDSGEMSTQAHGPNREQLNFWTTDVVAKGWWTEVAIAQLTPMNNSKVLIISPMPPLRGGIAWHSHYLAKHLKHYQNTEVWSPRKLYPSWLYPGRSQVGEDSAIKNTEAKRADRTLSQIGILFGLFRMSRSDFDAVMVPWWTSYFSIHMIFVAFISRAKGINTSIFCHNVYPHNGSAVGRALSRLVVRLFSNVFVQSQSEFELVKSFYPEANCTIVAHPTYPIERMQRAELLNRNRQGEPIKVLFFGLIREYKGIDTLLEAIRLINPEQFLFHFAGEPWSRSLEINIIEAKQRSLNISCDLSYHSELRMIETFDSSDVLVLPYSKASGSGALASAKGMGIPVIMSDSIEAGSDFVAGRDGLVFRAGDANHLALQLDVFRRNRTHFDNCWQTVDHDKEWELLAKKISGELGL